MFQLAVMCHPIGRVTKKETGAQLAGLVTAVPQVFPGLVPRHCDLPSLPGRHSPGPLSMNTTLESGRKLEPVSTSSSPPLTEQALGL